MIERIHAEDGPNYEEMGVPISQAIVHEKTVYVAGQVGVDPRSGTIVEGGVAEQTKQAFENISTILEEVDISLESVVKATVFLTDIDDFSIVNDVYGEYMTEPYPARSAYEVGDLASEYEVEVEVIAAL